MTVEFAPRTISGDRLPHAIRVTGRFSTPSTNGSFLIGSFESMCCQGVELVRAN